MKDNAVVNLFNRAPIGVQRFYDETNKEHYLATSRRSVVKAGAALATMSAVGFGLRSAVSAQSDDSGTPSSTLGDLCILTPELTEGPYYLDDMILRDDVTEGKAGIPLELTLLVLDAASCTPLENAAVEIWHCDAMGFYSGFTENSPGGSDGYVDDGSDPNTFMRGIQLTDGDGYATFKTIYPGWYAGREIHIHMMVQIGGESSNGTYEGGHVSHTGQLAFADEITDEVALIEPYSTKSEAFTRFEEDGVFGNVEDDDPSFFVALKQVDETDMAIGFTGTITVGVDAGASE